MDGGAVGNAAPPERMEEPVNELFLTPKLTPFFTPMGNEGNLEEAPLPTSFEYVGSRGPGRVLYFYEIVELLMTVRELGSWPESVASPMRRYYKREYPEFFSNGKRAAQLRAEKQQHARELKAENRPSRSRRKRVQTTGSEPIDIQSRRRSGA